MCLLSVMHLQWDCRWILVNVAVGSVGRLSCRLLCCSGWGEDIDRPEYFQILFIEGKWATGLMVGVFFLF